jgi:YegS/Rv2252/BmrU family lipid kinase
MERAMIIANPSSGKEEAAIHIEKISKQLQQNGYSTVIRLTEGEGDATKFAAEACDNKYKALISMGGDGTLNETINGIAEKEHRPILGIVPMGTVNDFARALNIPLDVEEAIGLLGKGKVNKADVGKINRKYFLNILALGGIAEATAEVTAERKTALGSLAYLLEGLKTLTDKTPFHLSVRSKEKNWEGEALLFLVALTNSIGGFEKLAPEAETNDGNFHCFIFKDVAIPKLIRMMTAIIRGRLQEDQDVIHFRSNEIAIYSKEPMNSNVDGDMGDKLPLKLRVLTEHIQVFCPE